MINRNISPLRYPGGKSTLAALLEATIYANKAQGGTYVEPFAGGAGAGLRLLADGHVDRILINDKDRAIYSFWNSVVRKSEEFIDRIHTAPLTIDEWERQREIYQAPARRTNLDLGFAAFYLNRCNRSGIIMNAGPIGGMKQKGKWKLDARFNRPALAGRVEELASYGDRIVVSCRDAFELIGELTSIVDDKRVFVYADPPYYVKGGGLYLNHFSDSDHKRLSELIGKQQGFPWIMTYDDAPRIRELYACHTVTPFRLRYSAHSSSTEGGEVLISPSHVRLPKGLRKMLIGEARIRK